LAQTSVTQANTSKKGCLGPENQKTVVVESQPKPQIKPKNEKLEWQSLSARKYEVVGRVGSSFEWLAENGNVVSGLSTAQAEIDWKPNQMPYQLKVREITKTGCEAETDFTTLAYDSSLFIPSLITPNEDGKNEFFEIKNLNFFPENEIEIYDRWGKRIFQASPYEQNWPKEKMGCNTYFFVLKSQNEVQKGWILLVE